MTWRQASRPRLFNGDVVSMRADVGLQLVGFAVNGVCIGALRFEASRVSLAAALSMKETSVGPIGRRGPFWGLTQRVHQPTFQWFLWDGIHFGGWHCLNFMSKTMPTTKMTGNGKFRPPRKMVMTGGGLHIVHIVVLSIFTHIRGVWNWVSQVVWDDTWDDPHGYWDSLWHWLGVRASHR